MLLHIAPPLEPPNSLARSIWQRLSPPCRLLCSLVGVFAIALTPNGQWQTWLIYGLALLVLLMISQANPKVLLKRLGVELIFVSLVALGILFQRQGEILWEWGWLQVTTPGLVVMGSVVTKMILSLLLLNILILTTSITDLLNSLRVLGIPPLLVAVLASMYRYIGLLMGEFQAMQRAAQARNLVSTATTMRLVLGHTIGSLFIRTYERGERIHQAMAARGYDSAITNPTPQNFQIYDPKNPLDIVAFILTAIIGLVGQLI